MDSKKGRKAEAKSWEPDTGKTRPYMVVHLADKVPAAKGIEWTSADVPHRPGSPLVTVRYKIDGKRQRKGLRLDLGKRAFLDEPQDERVRRAIKNHGPDLITYIGENKIRLTQAKAAKTAPLMIRRVEDW